MQAEHPLDLLVRGTLAHLAPKFDAPGPSRCQAGLDPIADQVALELRQARHDGAHQFAARGAETQPRGRSTQDLVQTLDDLHGWKASVLAQTGLSFESR